MGRAAFAFGLGQVEILRHETLYAFVAIEEWSCLGAFALASIFIIVTVGTAFLAIL